MGRLRQDLELHSTLLSCKCDLYMSGTVWNISICNKTKQVSENSEIFIYLFRHSSVGLISTVFLTMRVKGDSSWKRAVLKTCKYTQQSTLNLGQFHTHFKTHYT